jgi:hypothetical protein
VRKFDVLAKSYNLDQYWSALPPVIDSFQGAANVLTNPDLDAGSTGFTPSNGTIINFINNSDGNNVFRIRPAGVAIAIRSTSVQTTQQFEEWYFECRVRATVPVTTSGFLIITAEVFNDGANAASANINSSAVSASSLNSEWKTISGTYTVPTVRNGIRFRLFLDGTVTDGEIEVDNFRMKRKNGKSVLGQIESQVSEIAFPVDQLVNNRNIVSDSPVSIRLDSNVGNVISDPFTNFAIGMILYPDLSDVWVFRADTGIVKDQFADAFTDSFVNSSLSAYAGVKVNSDSTVSLLWPVGNSIREQKILFTEQVSYLAFSVSEGVATLQLNDQQVSQDADELVLTGFVMGAAESGSVLVDKIAFSKQGTVPTARKYFDLFRSQRLDNVARPNGRTTFSYVNDIREPIISQINQAQFSYEDGYFYATYQNLLADGVWSIDKRAPFPMEYSVDQGANWLAMPVKFNLSNSYANILFRHNTESSQNYYIEIRTSGQPEIPLAFFDATVTGSLHLPGSVGQGYYDVDYARFDQAQLVITPQSETEGIRTIEFLGSDLVLPGAPITYINGKDRTLSSMVHGQIYHVVAVYDTLQSSIALNAFEISGVGASEMPYSSSDAYFIYNVFAGNTFVSALETIGEPVDGIAPNAIGGNAASALSVQWNS